jgi:hypothetical protein
MNNKNSLICYYKRRARRKSKLEGVRKYFGGIEHIDNCCSLSKVSQDEFDCRFC